MGLTREQKIAVVVAITACAFAYIHITKRYSLLCPVTYTRYFSSSSTTGAAASGSAEAGTRKFTLDELKQYDGTDPTQIFVAVKGKVYRVSPQFYGKGASYNCFAGTEASRNLAKGIIGKDEANADWRNLNEEHMASLESWVAKFEEKYSIVGTIVEDEEYIKKGKEFAP